MKKELFKSNEGARDMITYLASSFRNSENIKNFIFYTLLSKILEIT